MQLDHLTLALIAVGASVSANCQPCLECNINTARQCGADAQQIAAAIEIGQRVRRGAAGKMDKFIVSLNHALPTAARPTTGGCGCGLSA